MHLRTVFRRCAMWKTSTGRMTDKSNIIGLEELQLASYLLDA
jgi:hypothetical protein